MSLKDLAYTPEELAQQKQEQMKYSAMPATDDPGGQPKYPWGLELRLEDGSLTKLETKASDFQVGQDITATVIFKVTSISMSERIGGKSEQCLGLTATQMDLGEPSKSIADVADQLYGTKA